MSIMQNRPYYYLLASFLALFFVFFVAMQDFAVAEEPINIAELEKEAEQGDADAQFNLGMMYDIGLGVKQDYKKAKYYYKQVAEQGHEEAKKELKFLE